MKENIEEISVALGNIKGKRIIDFLEELLTPSEINTLSKRWRILKMLNAGYTQREIAEKLGVSLCKVTRGAKILKKENSITKKL